MTTGFLNRINRTQAGLRRRAGDFQRAPEDLGVVITLSRVIVDTGRCQRAFFIRRADTQQVRVDARAGVGDRRRGRAGPAANDLDRRVRGRIGIDKNEFLRLLDQQDVVGHERFGVVAAIEGPDFNRAGRRGRDVLAERQAPVVECKFPPVKGRVIRAG